MVPTLTIRAADLLAESRQLALRAERKSPQTLKAYGDGVRQPKPVGSPSCSKPAPTPQPHARVSSPSAGSTRRSSVAAPSRRSWLCLRSRGSGTHQHLAWAYEAVGPLEPGKGVLHLAPGVFPLVVREAGHHLVKGPEGLLLEAHAL